MKLTDEKKYIEHDIDIIELIEKLKEKYRTVYWIHLDGDIYIYKPLGRKDYKDLVDNKDVSTMDKEDEVIKKTLLYPDVKYLDIDELPAGIVNKLFTTIMENSFLADLESRTALMNYYRNEMYDLSNQIPCLINEAFPQYDIEEIENWDIERTSKYLSRAEWKLQNLRGLAINYDLLEEQEEQYSNINSSQENQDKEQSSNMNLSEDIENSAIKTKKKDSLTPDKIQELKRKFPEINWDNDTILNEGINAMTESIDVLSPALRIPD